MFACLAASGNADVSSCVAVGVFEAVAGVVAVFDGTACAGDEPDGDAPFEVIAGSAWAGVVTATNRANAANERAGDAVPIRIIPMCSKSSSMTRTSLKVFVVTAEQLQTPYKDSLRLMS